MVNIMIKEFLAEWTTNDDGAKLRQAIDENFSNGNQVAISFKDVYGVNTSFVNSAFIDLLETYDFDYIKKNLKFTDSNKQVNNLILSRFKFEVEKSKLVTCV